MPLLAKDLGISPAEFGVVVSAMGFSRLLVNIPAAWAAEHYGRRPLLWGGPILTAVGMLATALSRSFEQLVGTRIITGVGSSMQMSAAQLYLTDISSASNRARTMAPLMAAFSAGACVGPAIGGFLAHHFGLQVPFLVVGGAVILVAINNYRLPETKPSAGRSPPLRMDGVDAASAMFVAEAEPKNKPVRLLIWDEVRSTLRQWKPLMQSRDVSSVILLHCAYWTVASGCMWTLMPMLATNTFGFSASSLGGVFTLMSVFSVAGAQPAAWLADKFGRKMAIVPACAMLAAAAAAIPAVADVAQFYGVVVLWSAGATLLASTPTAYIADVTAASNRAQAFAMLRSAGDLGILLGASVLGWVAHASSMTTAFVCAASVLSVAGVNFALRARESVERNR